MPYIISAAKEHATVGEIIKAMKNEFGEWQESAVFWLFIIQFGDRKVERKIVHVVGTGTIGEPLIGLLCDYENKLGIDEVTFHKNSALKNDRSKVFDLIDLFLKFFGLDL